MSVTQQLTALKSSLPPGVTLVAVSKTHPVEKIREAYAAGQRIFGENKVQEMQAKQAQLPADIQWHLIGHLQSNKVKDIAPFVALIHSVDSLKLLLEIDKQALKNKRIIDVLLQVYIATEETKFGLDIQEVKNLLLSADLRKLQHIRICGLMGMGSNTANEEQVRLEFRTLKLLFDSISFPICYAPDKPLPVPGILSMGMSSDYRIAIAEGSTLLRIGSTIFGTR